MPDFNASAFKAWLKAQSRSAAPLHFNPQSTAIRAFKGVMPTADSESPVVANSLLSGSRALDALHLDTLYVDAPPGNASVAALVNSPATGCSMLMTLAREKSGYNPNIPAQSGSVSMFLSYVDQILKCPLFTQVLNDRITPSLSGDWNHAIDQIIGYYVGIPDSELSILRQSLIDIAAAASSNPSTNQTLNLFSQSTINVSDDIMAYLYFSNVQMKTTVTHGGKNEPDRVSNQTNLFLCRVQLDFLEAEWAGQAAAVYEETQQSLTDWLSANSTPVGSLPSDWHPR